MKNKPKFTNVCNHDKWLYESPFAFKHMILPKKLPNITTKFRL